MSTWQRVAATVTRRSLRIASNYGQLVSDRTIAYVNMVIGRGRLLELTDPYLNDIPLEEWDRLSVTLPLAGRFSDLGDCPSLAGLVCVAKEAARQWIEQQTTSDDSDTDTL